MKGKRADTLRQTMGRIETFTLGRVWTDLADEELFWEPVAGAWGIRRRDECRSLTPFGNGEWVVDFGPEAAEPMTTIGWLLWHIGSMPGRLVEIDVLGGTKTMASGWASPYLTHHPVFTDASHAVETLRAGWSALGAVLETASDEQLERRTPGYTYAPEPFSDGLAVLGPPGPEQPAVYFVAGVLNEISHHGSQICTLRDLYRATRAGR